MELKNNELIIPEWPIFDETEANYLIDSLTSGFWAGSRAKYIKEVTKNFLELQNGKYGTPLANGTVTMEAALKALKIGEGDEVIVPALTFYSTVSVVLKAGATPVIVDVDKDTFQISINDIKKVITHNTKAIIPVHLAGGMCDMDEIISIADEYNIKVIEDCAHAHGSYWRGQGAGTIGDFGSFSFQHSKLISSGEGGFLIAKNNNDLEKAWNYANCGRTSKTSVYGHSSIGTNCRMSDLQAAVLNAQIQRYKTIQQKTREYNAKYLSKKLSEIEGIRVQKYDSRMTKKAFYNFVFIIDPKVYGNKKCKEVFELCNEYGIPTSLPYPPLNELAIFNKDLSEENYSDLSVKLMDTPNAKYISENSIWLHHKLLLADEHTLDIFVDLLIMFLGK